MRSVWTALCLVFIFTAGLLLGSTVWSGTELAQATEPAHPQQDSPSPAMRAATIVPGPASLPLRWRVAYAGQTPSGGTDGTFCGTAVVVWNTAQSAVSAQVEFFRHSLLPGIPDSLGYVELSLPPNVSKTCWTSDAPRLSPINLDGEIAGFTEVSGFATVHASDPRIIVSAYLVCRDDALGTAGANVGLTTIPAFPVGASAEFFTAGMPPVWTPPVAVPEEPQ